MNAASYRKILETNYDHMFSLWRDVLYESPIGDTRSKRELVAADVPCRFSLSNEQPLSNKDGLPVIVYQAKIFCSPDVLILAGDRVEVTVDGQVKAYVTGEPVIRTLGGESAHQEAPLKRAENA